MGVRGAVDAAGFVRATGNTVQWADQSRRVEPFESGARGYQVSRDAFDALLAAGAQAEGAVVRTGAAVRGVERDAGSDALWRITFDGADGSHVHLARWVLDCSGRAGVVARRMKRRGTAGVRTMAVAGVWERTASWPMEDDSHTLVESYEGGWAWSVPVSATRRYVTLMLDPALTQLAGRAHLHNAYATELARTSALRTLVDGATSVGEPWACDASAYAAERVFEDHLLLVGDAGSFVDPLSSFGVKKALASAWLASVVVHSALSDASLTSPALELFAMREREMYQNLQRQSAELACAAAGSHDSGFWRSRGEAEMAEPSDAQMLSALRAGGAHVAFEELKRRSSITLRVPDSVGIVQCATVQGHRIVLREHLVTSRLPLGVRYLRNVDLVVLARVAPQHNQVPALFDAYNRAAPPAPLHDFLAALSAMLSLGLLTLD